MNPSCRLLTVLLALFTTGCLHFESQTLSYRYHKSSDTLRIFQDYRGISGSDAKGKPGKPLSGEEVRQLDSVLEGQRTFFFANWIFEYDRSKTEEQLRDLADPAKRAEMDIEADDVPAWEEFLRLLLDNVQVENGPFYLDADGKLCGVQMVRVSNLSSVIETTNQLAPVLLKPFGEEFESPADKQAFREFVRSKKTLLERDGNRLLLHWPLSKTSYDEEFGDKAEDPEDLEKFRKAGFGYTHADKVVTFQAGKQDDEITRLTLDLESDPPYVPNLVAPAGRKHVVKKTFDPQAAARKFLLGGEQK